MIVVIAYCIFNRTSIALVRGQAVVVGNKEQRALEEEGIHLKQNRLSYCHTHTLMLCDEVRKCDSHPSRSWRSPFTSASSHCAFISRHGVEDVEGGSAGAFG